MKTIRARITYIICMLPDGHLFIIKNSIHALTLFMTHTHGTTIILSLVMRTLFLPILIMLKDFKLKRFVKASALTFRAYAFEKLVHYYCWRWQDSNNGASQGLVLRIDESTGGQGYATLAETYVQIYKDLDEAIALYNQSGMDRDAAQVWMPNVNVAHAVYARAAITKQDYTKALSEAKLARQNYPLMSNAEYQSGFCNPTSEWIFGCFGGSQENNWYWSYGTQFACNGYYASANNTGAGAIGRELINRIPDNDARKALFLTEDKFPGYDLMMAQPWI